MVVAIYKPKGPTSHDIINQVRKLTGERRVGHAGTLDTLASGVLVIGIGREATKKLGEIVAKEKEYLAVIRLGMTSTTDDEEGVKTATKYEKDVKIRKSDVTAILAQFTGRIMQTPPAYSAIKIKGQKAYALARRGKTPALKPRPVEIKSIKLLSYRWPNLKLRVVTGPGVYIRALARDIGEHVGVGGYLADLVRTRVGDFTLHRAARLIELPPAMLSRWGREP